MQNRRGIEFTKLTLDDVEEMAECIRPMDALENHIITLQPLIHTLQQVYKRSEKAYAARFNGRLLCIFGRMPRTILSGDCNLWMVATSMIDEDKKAMLAFARVSKSIVHRMAKNYERAWNIVYDKNHRTIRWLKHCGFQFDEKPIMINGHGFYRFELKGSHHVS